MRPTIFHILLSIYLRPRASHPLLFTPALSLISSHASQIDAVQVFDLLPPLVALSDIQVFLEKALRRSGERRREEATLRGIAGSLREKAEMEVVQLEERRVKIDHGRLFVLNFALCETLLHTHKICVIDVHTAISDSVIA